MTHIKHLTSIDQLDKPLVEKLLQKATYASLDRPTPRLFPYVLATLFFEPSTRTRLSFETAMLRLGGSVISLHDGKQSSAAKGETLEDTVMTVSNYANIIAVRHPDNGAAELAAKVATVPIVNAGDGSGEHPTQALLDAYTIFNHHRRLDGLKIALVGDLKFSRTVRSLVKVLSLFGDNEYHTLPMSDYNAVRLPDLTDRNVTQVDHRSNITTLLSKVKNLDVVYMTRPQLERWNLALCGEGGRSTPNCRLRAEHLKSLPEKAIILHPLPRNQEIEREIDKDPRALYFTKQVQAGVFVRMAVLEYLLEG